MKRNPELAHKVSEMPHIQELRHTAIDKITSAALAAGMLGRNTLPEGVRKLNPVHEIELEIKLNELLDDAGFYFRKYLRDKIFTYENELHKTLDKGNKEIVSHSNALNELRQERGLNNKNNFDEQGGQI